MKGVFWAGKVERGLASAVQICKNMCEIREAERSACVMRGSGVDGR